MEDYNFIKTNPEKQYSKENRNWQGIPTIERTPNGTLWAAWYSGGKGEGPENYVIVVRSKDNGKTWTPPIFVIDPPDEIRAFDPCLWRDNRDRLWLFWNMSRNWFDGKSGVWCIRTENPDAENPFWSKPKRIVDGVIINKPTILSTGEYLLCAAIWNREPFVKEMDKLRFSNVYISTDEGENWNLLGSADIPQRTFDEHMIVELKDGRLWMLVRTSYGIGESFSFDRGKTWTKGKPSSILGPDSRFHIRRHKSGNLLLVNHYSFKDKIRSYLTAFLSENEGKTWDYKLLLDEREKVSYPDATEGEDGTIFIIYDHDRYGKKEILMAIINENDIKMGKIITITSKLKILINS